MSVIPAKTLEDAIRQSGEGWLIELYAPPAEAMHHLRQVIEEINQRAQSRLGAHAPQLTETSLVEEFGRRPQQVRGFFQALGGTRTPDMLLMVWRIIQGMEVQDVEVSYHRKKAFQVRVVLRSPYGEADEVYESDRIQDFALFRHIGILEIDRLPVFDGFYALRVREA